MIRLSCRVSEVIALVFVDSTAKQLWMDLSIIDTVINYQNHGYTLLPFILAYTELLINNWVLITKIKATHCVTVSLNRLIKNVQMYN